MAGTLVRVTDFVPATPILSGEIDAEFNQIVNLLNGTTTNVKATLDVSDAGDPPLELNQLSTGPILKGFQAGIEKIRIRNDGSIRTPGFYDSNENEQLLLVTVASAVNEFSVANAATGNPPELRATGGNTDISLKLVPKGTGVVQIQAGAPVAGADAANKTYVDGKKISFAAPAYIGDPSTATLNSALFGATLIPEGGTYTITKCKLFYKTGSHTAGGSVSFQMLRTGVGVTSTITLDNTNNTINTVYEDNFGDFTASANEIFFVQVSARSGTITERDVTMVLEGYRIPF